MNFGLVLSKPFASYSTTWLSAQINPFTGLLDLRSVGTDALTFAALTGVQTPIRMVITAVNVHGYSASVTVSLIVRELGTHSDEQHQLRGEFVCII